MDILAWVNTTKASEDRQSWQQDVPECPHTSPILERPNTSSHWSYNEGSEAKIRIFYFPFCEIFIDRNDSVNVIGLDYNLIQVLVMPISTYDYSNIS